MWISSGKSFEKSKFITIFHIKLVLSQKPQLMIFTRSYRYETSMSEEEIRKCLLGGHIPLHQMDFEVSEKDKVLRIIPHAEQDNAVKTLPITHVHLKQAGAKTSVLIKSKIRKIDKGGPMLIVFFCAFIFLAAVVMLALGNQEAKNYMYSFFAISIVIFLLFWVRMERGYFDYVRKIRDYVKQKCIK